MRLFGNSIPYFDSVGNRIAQISAGNNLKNYFICTIAQAFRNGPQGKLAAFFCFLKDAPHTRTDTASGMCAMAAAGAQIR